MQVFAAPEGWMGANAVRPRWFLPYQFPSHSHPQQLALLTRCSWFSLLALKEIVYPNSNTSIHHSRCSSDILPQTLSCIRRPTFTIPNYRSLNREQIWIARHASRAVSWNWRHQQPIMKATDVWGPIKRRLNIAPVRHRPLELRR